MDASRKASVFCVMVQRVKVAVLYPAFELQDLSPAGPDGIRWCRPYLSDELLLTPPIRLCAPRSDLFIHHAFDACAPWGSG